MKPHTEPSALFRALTTHTPVGALERAHEEWERRLLLDRTVRAVEHERAKMAAELHNGPIQQLACFGWTLDRVVRELERGRVDVDKNWPQARDARHLWDDPERQGGQHDLAALG